MEHLDSAALISTKLGSLACTCANTSVYECLPECLEMKCIYPSNIHISRQYPVFVMKLNSFDFLRGGYVADATYSSTNTANLVFEYIRIRRPIERGGCLYEK